MFFSIEKPWCPWRGNMPTRQLGMSKLPPKQRPWLHLVAVVESWGSCGSLSISEASNWLPNNSMSEESIQNPFSTTACGESEKNDSQDNHSEVMARYTAYHPTSDLSIRDTERKKLFEMNRDYRVKSIYVFFMKRNRKVGDTGINLENDRGTTLQSHLHLCCYRKHRDHSS